MRLAWLMVCGLALPVAAQPMPRGPLLVSLYAGYATAQALDIDSTLRFRDDGFRESNRHMRGCVRIGLPCLVPVKAAVTAGILLAVDQITRRQSKPMAIATMLGLNAIQWAVVGTNYLALRPRRD